MLKVIVIGHLGSDAVVKDFNGAMYASFSVAHTEKYTDSNNVQHEKTEWVSCLKRVKDGSSGVVPYLKKGIKVYIEGNLTKKMYETQTKWECALNCNVSELQLLSQKQDSQQDYSSVQPNIVKPQGEYQHPTSVPPLTDDLPF